jgi:uncharacterized protein YecE (DUF72 family)
MVMGWVGYSPDDFVYTAKLTKLITHVKKLDVNQGVEEDLEKFMELMEPLSLGGKLGCVLIQLPPKYDYRPKELEDFFKILPTHVRFAVELRDPSWIDRETWPLLEKYKVAYTNVDEPLLPPEIHVTSSIAYFRWHGRGTRLWFDYRYSGEQLEPWVPKVLETAKKTDKVFGYFNNHYHGYAVENCLQLLEMLGTQTPQQALTKKRIETYFKNVGTTEESRLELFAEPKRMSLEELLRYFVAVGRLERARTIADSDLTIIKQTNERIEATIREYHIVVDPQQKTVSHDCADWEKIMSTGKLCKHIAKLLLSIDVKKATTILEQVYKEKEAWQFKRYSQ